MGEFNPITSQEELNAVIGRRLSEERDSMKEKYKGQIDTLQSEKATYEQNAKESAEKYAALEKRLAEVEASNKAYEIKDLKQSAAIDAGLPLSLASRISGDTEEAIKADAKALSELFATQHRTPPLRSDEVAGGGDQSKEAMLAALKQLKGE